MKYINNIAKMIASIKPNRFIKNLETTIGKQLLHDVIIMEGFVYIINGKTIIHGKNSIVDNGLIGIINLVSAHASNQGFPSYNWSGTNPATTYMVIGSNTTTPTTNGTTSLAAPIGTAPGTKPSSQSGTSSTPGAGQFQIQWTATWNPGTVPVVTLGEVGLYLDVNSALQAFQTSHAGTIAQLFSRMASADGKFTSFTINNTVPLSISWTFRLTYAT